MVKGMPCFAAYHTSSVAELLLCSHDLPLIAN